MKKLITFMLFAFMGMAQAQTGGHIEVSKNPGDPLTIFFWYVPTDPTTFDGIALESSTNIQGPYTDIAVTILKTDTSVTFPAPGVVTFYRWYCWKMDSSGTRVRGVASNVVQMSITTTGVPGAGAASAS